MSQETTRLPSYHSEWFHTATFDDFLNFTKLVKVEFPLPPKTAISFAE